MNIILLSGGSGKRLWPLSNDVRSKQFIKFLPPFSAINSHQEGLTLESMVQRVYRQIRSTNPEAIITIATSKSQVSALHNQLGAEIALSVEPCRRDTFAAIALAVSYLHHVKGVPADEAVVVCPVDPYVEDDYFKVVKKMYDKAKIGEKNIILMGIKPTYPSEKYGYIKPANKQNDNAAWTFTEKPTKEKAAQYISEGALWNGGVFAFRLSYVLDKSKEIFGTSDYAAILSGYAELKKISFDYAVVEQEQNLAVVKYSGLWKDIGTWNTLTEVMEEKTLGQATLADSCKNVHVINELGVPILALGLSNVVISASPQGILVSDKEQSSYIKPFVDKFDSEIMFAEKSWGSYSVLDVEEKSLTIKVTLNPNNRMNYHSHLHRDEVWTVISGDGQTIVDGMEQIVKVGDVITMAAGCKHTVIAGDKGLKLIEVQLGEEISVSDKNKYEMPL